MEDLGIDELTPYVDILRASPEEAALREVLTAVLSADHHDIAGTVERAAVAAEQLAAKGGPHADAYAAYAVLAHHFPGDPGVLAAMLLNHVQLQPGEALFLGAGIPHAYISGLGVELMANSDNVLRCGLTPKHVDVPELLRVVRFEAGDAGVLRPEEVAGEEVYETPIDEFRLSRFVLAAAGRPRALVSRTPQILLCTAGTVRLRTAEEDPEGTGQTELTLAPGESAFVRAGEQLTLAGEGTLYRATVVA